MSDEEIQLWINKYHILSKTKREDDKWFALIKKLIPNFNRYEDLAEEMADKYGLAQAMKKARKVKL